MAFPVLTPNPTFPEARDALKPPSGDEFAGLEELDRPELDEDAPMAEEPPTVPCLPTLDWDQDDDESGVKRRA